MSSKNSESTLEVKAANQSSNKMLLILECIAMHQLPIRLQDLATQLDMSQSTVLRYLKSLQKVNYIYQEEDTLRYALTWKICGLSHQIESYFGLRTVTNPFINKLSSNFRLGVCLVVEREQECVYLDCVDSPQVLSHSLQRIGKKAPLHATSSGKVLLSRYSELQLTQFLEENTLEQLTAYTIVDADKLIEEIKQVREQGYAMDDEECELGLRCVSYPIKNYSGDIIAAMSIFGNSDTMTYEKIKQQLLPSLREAADTISIRLGFDK